jgi:hypothetical protein
MPASTSLPVTAPGRLTLFGLTREEQARLEAAPEPVKAHILRLLALDDPICRAEAKKLLAPPPPPEPPPWSLATAELLSGLPGRPDRLAFAAGRLTQELEDPKSYPFYLKAAQAVCLGEQPSEALISAWRQGTNPQARKRGAVFVTAWGRETRPPT